MKRPDLDSFPQILSLHSLSRTRWRFLVGPMTTSQSWWGPTRQRPPPPPPQAAASRPRSPGLPGMPGRAGCLLWKVRAKNVCLPSRPSSSQQGYWWEGALRTESFSKLWALKKWRHGRFLGVFKIPLDFPQKEPPETAFLKCLCCLAPAIYLIWVHLSTTHNVSDWNLHGVQKNILQTRKKARRLGLHSFPLFLTVQPRPTACVRIHWAEKKISSCTVSKSGAINDS